MTIRDAHEGGVIVVSPHGRIDSTTSAILDRHLQGLAASGQTRVVVDFTGVDYISSAGLRVLLLAARRLKPPAGTLVLCGLAPSVRTVLELAGFTSLFTVEPSREPALARAGAGGP